MQIESGQRLAVEDVQGQEGGGCPCMVWASGACRRDGAPGGRGPVGLCMGAESENKVLLREESQAGNRLLLGVIENVYSSSPS